MHPPALSLHYLDAFQQTAGFFDYIDVRDQERLASYAEWLLFLGNGLEVTAMPDELRRVIRKKASRWLKQ